MDVGEYLAFVPLLLYGMGLADLFSEWKRFLDQKQFYLQYLLFTLFLTEIAIYNVYIYVHIVNQFEDMSYLTYLGNLAPPFLFLLVVNAFTPEKGENTKEAFIKRSPIVFGLLAVFIASHFLYDFKEGDPSLILRGIAIVLTAAAAIIKKSWINFLIIAIWILSIPFRLGIFF